MFEVVLDGDSYVVNNKEAHVLVVNDKSVGFHVNMHMVLSHVLEDYVYGLFYIEMCKYTYEHPSFQ